MRRFFVPVAVNGCEAWDAARLESQLGWRAVAPLQVVTEIGRRPADALFVDPTESPHLAAFGARIRKTVTESLGVAWVRGLDHDDWDAARRTEAHVALAQAIGRPLATTEGRLDGAHRAAGAADAFRTDGLARDAAPDVVGLVRAGGGESESHITVSSALRVHARMREEAFESLVQLYTDFLHDPSDEPDRGSVAAGENRFPIFAMSLGRERVAFRYSRSAIERGHVRGGEPLSPRQVEALDDLDRFLADPAQTFRISLEPGDVLWLNNRVVAHSAPEDEALRKVWVQLRSHALATNSL